MKNYSAVLRRGLAPQKLFLLLYISERNALHIILHYKFLKKHATEVLL